MNNKLITALLCATLYSNIHATTTVEMPLKERQVPTHTGLSRGASVTSQKYTNFIEKQFGAKSRAKRIVMRSKKAEIIRGVLGKLKEIEENTDDVYLHHFANEKYSEIINNKDVVERLIEERAQNMEGKESVKDIIGAFVDALVSENGGFKDWCDEVNNDQMDMDINEFIYCRAYAKSGWLQCMAASFFGKQIDPLRYFWKKKIMGAKCVNHRKHALNYLQSPTILGIQKLFHYGALAGSLWLTFKMVKEAGLVEVAKETMKGLTLAAGGSVMALTVVAGGAGAGGYALAKHYGVGTGGAILVGVIVAALVGAITMSFVKKWYPKQYKPLKKGLLAIVGPSILIIGSVTPTILTHLSFQVPYMAGYPMPFVVAASAITSIFVSFVLQKIGEKVYDYVIKEVEHDKLMKILTTPSSWIDLGPLKKIIEDKKKWSKKKIAGVGVSVTFVICCALAYMFWPIKKKKLEDVIE